MKLLAIKMVANNFLGFSNCSATIFFRLEVWLEALLSVDFVNEKKATSVPDIKAEHNNKNSNKRIPNTDITSILRIGRKIRSGSGSKCWN